MPELFDPSQENILDKLIRQNRQAADEFGMKMDADSWDTRPYVPETFPGFTPGRYRGEDFPVQAPSNIDTQQIPNHPWPDSILYKHRNTWRDWFVNNFITRGQDTARQFIADQAQSMYNTAVTGAQGLLTGARSGRTEDMVQFGGQVVRGARFPEQATGPASTFGASVRPWVSPTVEDWRGPNGAAMFVGALASLHISPEDLAVPPSESVARTVEAYLPAPEVALAAKDVPIYKQSFKEFNESYQAARTAKTGLKPFFQGVPEERLKNLEPYTGTGEPQAKELYRAHLETAIEHGKEIPAESLKGHPLQAYMNARYKTARTAEWKLGEPVSIKASPEPETATTEPKTITNRPLLMNGEPVGNLDFELRENGKLLYVEDVANDPIRPKEYITYKEGRPWSVGIRGLQQLRKQILEEYPTVEEIEGVRVSGERAEKPATVRLRIRPKIDGGGTQLEAVQGAPETELDAWHEEARREAAASSAAIQDAATYRTYTETALDRNWTPFSEQGFEAAYANLDAAEEARDVSGAPPPQPPTTPSRPGWMSGGNRQPLSPAELLRKYSGGDSARRADSTLEARLQDLLSKPLAALRDSAAMLKKQSVGSRMATLFDPTFSMTNSVRAHLTTTEGLRTRLHTLHAAAAKPLLQAYYKARPEDLGAYIDRSKAFVEDMGHGVLQSPAEKWLNSRVGRTPGLDTFLNQAANRTLDPAVVGAAEAEARKWQVVGQTFGQYLQSREIQQSMLAGQTVSDRLGELTTSILHGTSDTADIRNILTADPGFKLTHDGIRDGLDKLFTGWGKWSETPESVVGTLGSDFEGTARSVLAYRGGNLNPFVSKASLNTDGHFVENAHLYSNLPADFIKAADDIQEFLRVDLQKQREAGVAVHELPQAYFAHIVQNPPESGLRIADNLNRFSGATAAPFYTKSRSFATIEDLAGSGYNVATTRMDEMLDTRMALSARVQADAWLKSKAQAGAFTEREVAQINRYLHSDPSTIIHAAASGMAVVREAIATADMSYMIAIQGMQRFARSPVGWAWDIVNAQNYLTNQGYNGWIATHVDGLMEATMTGLSRSYAMDFEEGVLRPGHRFTPLETLLNAPSSLPLKWLSGGALKDFGLGSGLKYLNTVQYERLATIFKYNMWDDARQLMMAARDNGFWGAIAHDLKVGALSGLPLDTVQAVKLGKGLSNEQIMQVAAAHANYAMGGLEQALLGRSPDRRDWERFLLFAPDYTRSQVGMVFAALSPTQQGMLARTHLFSFYTNMALLATGLNLGINGEFPNITDRTKQDFGRVNLPGGGMLDLMGSKRRLLMAFGRTENIHGPYASKAEQAGNILEGMVDPRQVAGFLKGRISWGPETTYALLSNKNYNGQAIVTARDPLQAWGQRLGYVAGSMSPISYQQSEQAKQIGATNRPLQLGIALSGANVIPTSPQQTQILQTLGRRAVEAGLNEADVKAMVNGGKNPLLTTAADRRQLNSTQRENIIEQTAHELGLPASTVRKLGQVQEDSVQDKQFYSRELLRQPQDAEVASRARLQTTLSRIDPTDGVAVRKAIQNEKDQLQAAAFLRSQDPKFKEAMDYALTRDPKRLAVEPEGQALKEQFLAEAFTATLDPETGQPDYDRREAAIQQWSRMVGSGLVQQWLHEGDARKLPQERDFQDAEEKLRPYWDIGKTVLTPAQYQVYHDYKQTRAISGGVAAHLYIISHPEAAQYDAMVQAAQAQLRAASPTIDALLVKWYGRQPENPANLQEYIDRIQKAAGQGTGSTGAIGTGAPYTPKPYTPSGPRR